MLSRIFWLSGCLYFSGCTNHLEKYSHSEAVQTRRTSQNVTTPKKVHKIRDRVYRVDADHKSVMTLFVDALMEHYNISLLDTKTGLLTTEWDRFYQEDRVYRNKLSVLVRPSGWGRAEVKISNNVEVLSTKGVSAGKIWLPSGDKGAEEIRVTSLLEGMLQGPPPGKARKPTAG